MGTKVILVRHGETKWNSQSRFQGSKDIKLNKEGKQQAKSLAKRFKIEKIDAVYASDLNRAYKTAEIVAKEHDIVVEQVTGLREINFGQWEGLTYDEIEQNSELTLTEWMKDPVNNRIPKGESLEDVQLRTVKSLKEIISDQPDKTVLIVTHGGVIRVLVSTFLGVPLANAWRLKQTNTAVNILSFYDEEVILELFNCTVHLGDNRDD